VKFSKAAERGYYTVALATWWPVKRTSHNTKLRRETKED
jgi:hypothetical protein